MEIVQRPGGVEVSLTEFYRLIPESSGDSQRRGGRPDRRRRTPDSDRLLIESLLAVDDGISLVDELVFEPTKQPTGPSGRRGHQAPRIRARQDLQVRLELDEGFEGVVLLEQDGMYTWHFPHERETGSGERRGARATGRRSATFQIEIYAESSAGRRGSRKGFIKNLVYNTVRAFVLKFAAAKFAGGAAKFLERKLHPGLVAMPSPDPTSWVHLNGGDHGGYLSATGAGPRKFLLMLHGTFSKTMTCYGALGVSSWGQAFIEAANRKYDSVIGFDHPTLSVTPDRNADELYRQLRALVDSENLKLDVVAHSRGGLVFRSLVEQVLPGLTWRPEVGPAVFVGVPNAGTTLAEPENWHAFVDLYTNLAVAACRALALWPQATFVSKIMQEVIEAIGDLVKYMATEAVTRRRIPGLSAMQPSSAFIRRLNETQAGQPVPAESDYYAVTSTFDVELLKGLDESNSLLKQLPRHFLMVVVDNIANRLLGSSCDLVVNTDSMCQVDPLEGGFIKETYDFGVNPHVYHTVYFTRPEVAGALAKWLGLPAITQPEGRRGSRTRGHAVRSLEELIALEV